MENIAVEFKRVRDHSITLCDGLTKEDYVCQPELFVSPPKWHLAHSTWFFETFVLQKAMPGYKPFHPMFHFLFNSYYETAGEHLSRARRGTLSRPSIDEIFAYRRYVDDRMMVLCETDPDEALRTLIITGLHHEQQHQELLVMDIKYILGCNPLFPPYATALRFAPTDARPVKRQLLFDGGNYVIGHDGRGFAFDNESPKHTVFIQPFSMDTALVTNKEYMDFIADGGYQNVALWHSDGWEWVRQNQARHPLYWHTLDGVWHNYTFGGLEAIKENEPVMHVNFYEAAAYASWKGERLPTEAEWEVAAPRFDWGEVWEHTMSAYMPYPGYRKPEGTIGEYNAKFMINQMVLRGASCATPPGHQRITYRNFFAPQMQWQFAGIRLAHSL